MPRVQTRDAILAQLGLALVTVLPAFLALALTLLTPSARVGAGGFTPAFFGFSTVIVVSFGWLFVLPSMTIAIRGLTRRRHLVTNALSLACSAVWIALYWFVTHFR